MPKLRINDLLPDVGEEKEDIETLDSQTPETGLENPPGYLDELTVQEHGEQDVKTEETAVQTDKADTFDIDEFIEPPPSVKQAKNIKRNKVYYVGMFSAALSMVVLGIAFIVSLFTTGGMPNVLKLSPIVLVFLGLELFLNWYFQKGRRIRFDISGYAASLIMVVIAAGLSALSVSVSNSDSARINLERRYENELQNKLAQDLKGIINVKDINISFTTYESDISGYSSLFDIKDTDKLELRFYFRNTQKTLMDFASDCRKILMVLNTYGLPFGNISFIADDGLNSIRVNINGKFEMDISENELARLAFYFAGDFVEDLVDYE